MKFLNGYKTYIVAAIAALVTFAYSLDWLTDDQVKVIYAFLAAIGLATTRQAIGKVAAILFFVAVMEGSHMRTNDLVRVVGRLDVGRVIALESADNCDRVTDFVYVEFGDGRQWLQPWDISWSGAAAKSSCEIRCPPIVPLFETDGDA